LSQLPKKNKKIKQADQILPEVYGTTLSKEINELCERPGSDYLKKRTDLTKQVWIS
jgi:hypothetical protein